MLAKAERSSFTDKIIDAARTMVENWRNDKRLELLDGTLKDTETDPSVVWVSQLPFCIKEKFLKVSKDLLPEKINLRVTVQKLLSLKTILSRPQALEVKTQGVFTNLLLIENWQNVAKLKWYLPTEPDLWNFNIFKFTLWFVFPEIFRRSALRKLVFLLLGHFT